MLLSIGVSTILPEKTAGARIELVETAKKWSSSKTIWQNGTYRVPTLPLVVRTLTLPQQEGMAITPEQLAYLSPMDWEHINLTGDSIWDLTVKSPHARQLNVQFSGFDTLTPISAIP
ncbi:Tn3 family transposase [Ktedonobacter sp. SOSP1-52]|uniref:Tn3 family transposase n=1 Tax=Ktedonobacter sp. SOSP1-52 TaxID=2778366 RepID=UPI0019160033|nr:Tn3 family transposase [Ktedonobacter sp. SOSP1-52]